MELEAYRFVLLHGGLQAAEYTEEELAEIQAGHLAFLERMREVGHLLLALE